MVSLARDDYAARYGPTTGDKLRLGDTDLFIEIERDDAQFGNEVLNGWGKTFRLGMSLAFESSADSELDSVVTNVVLLDPVVGVVKTSIGIKDGLIVGTGRPGNPDIHDGIDLRLGPGTVAIPGENLIATPGGVDTHVHLRTPRLLATALTSGLTTLVTGGTSENPSFNLYRAFESFESVPVNVGMLGRAASPDSMRRQLESGACGIKIHEDWAGYPSTIRAALDIASDYDVAVAMHTDGLNEAGSLSDTLDAIGGRAIHAYHVEGSGGGHPDVIRIAAEHNVIGSSTTPTLPFGRNAAAELHAMLWAVHGLNRNVESNRRMVAERVRESTMRAESYLQDIGAIAIVNSDSQGMGRIGEVIRRTWQLAHLMKHVRPEDTPNDNDRVLRYLAKYTINPARTHGIGRWVGSLEPGKLADIVLWQPSYFGVKPEVVIKGGYPAWGVTGDGNATVVKSEPTYYGPLTGGYGRVPSSISVAFVSDASSPAFARMTGTRRRIVPVKDCRSISKADMSRNQVSPDVAVDPASLEVLIDGIVTGALPDEAVPLNRRYFLM